MSEGADLGITVAISTIGARADYLRLPPPCPSLNYLLLVQRAEDSRLETLLQRFAGRSDLHVVALEGLGLSNSRNAALDMASEPLLLFSDDDLDLNPEGIAALGRCFATDPTLDLAAGWRQGRVQRPKSRLTYFNSGRICAPELMVRRETIQRGGVTFDPEFGLGGRYGLGEEYIFVTDALKAGCRGMSFPIVTGVHPHESTGEDWKTQGLMQARQAMLRRVFGPWRLIIRPLYALRYRRRFASTEEVLRFSLNKTLHDT